MKKAKYHYDEPNHLPIDNAVCVTNPPPVKRPVGRPSKKVAKVINKVFSGSGVESPFGRMLRTVLKNKNLTIREVANRMGIMEMGLYQIIRGERPASEYSVIQIFNAINPSNADKKRLLNAAKISVTHIKIKTLGCSEGHYVLADRLGKKFNSLSDEQVAKIIDIIDQV